MMWASCWRRWRTEGGGWCEPDLRGLQEGSSDDILCLDCSLAYVILLKLLYEHPELAEDDVRRVAEVFEWRMKKTATSESEAKPEAVAL